MTKVENLKSDLSVISSFEYERDRTGNPLSILREDGSCVYYEYDLNQQLTAETQTDDTGAVVYAWEWDYDRAGNRLWQTFNGAATYYTYNAGNELITETTGGATTYYDYDYDRNGNQTAKQAVDGTTYFHYDFENLLRQIDLPDGAHNYFTYDADSKRVSAQDSSGYTRFIYQGPDMLKLMQERNAAGETQAQYTMGQGLESMRRGTASSFYHYDALGSTQELTDAGEAVTDTYRYNAWGEAFAHTGTTINPHRFVGRARYYLTPDPALYLLGLRYFAPLLARFLTMDPLSAGISVAALSHYELPSALWVALNGLTWDDNAISLFGAVGRGLAYPYCANGAPSRSDPTGLIYCDQCASSGLIGWFCRHVFCTDRPKPTPPTAQPYQPGDWIGDWILKLADSIIEGKGLPPLLEPGKNAACAIKDRDKIAAECLQDLRTAIGSIPVPSPASGFGDAQLNIELACSDCGQAIATAAGIDTGWMVALRTCQGIADDVLSDILRRARP